MQIKTVDGIWCCNNAANEYKRVVDNTLGVFARIYFEKKIIKINKNKNRSTGQIGEIINAIIHEELHARHPRMKHDNIYKKAAELEKSLSASQKSKLRKRYK